MIKDQIEKSLVKALKEKDMNKVKVLRYTLSLIKYQEIDNKKELTDEEIVEVIKKDVKKRNEAISLFKKGGRIELVEDEQNQIKVLKKYLPEELSEDEVLKIIKKTIKDLPQPQIGQVIGLVIKETKGRADGSLVARLVKENL